MEDYENFVARMGSFDMDLTTPETDQDLLNDTLEHFCVKGMGGNSQYTWQNGGSNFIRQNGSKAASKVVSEANSINAQRQLKRYL